MDLTLLWAGWWKETQLLGNTSLPGLLAALLGMDRQLWGLRGAHDKQNHSSLPKLCLSFPLESSDEKGPALPSQVCPMSPKVGTTSAVLDTVVG